MENRKEFFDRHAASWDRQRRYDDIEAQLGAVVAAFGLKEGGVVLDVGTGTGVLLPWIRQAIGAKGRLMAMDFSYRMLEEVSRSPSFESEGLVNGSVEWIPFPSARFDHVTCFSAFPHFPDKGKALSEMARVLKHRGSLSIAHLKSAEEILQFHRHAGGAVAHDRLPRLEDLRKMMDHSGLEEISIINQPGKFLAKGRKR